MEGDRESNSSDTWVAGWMESDGNVIHLAQQVWGEFVPLSSSKCDAFVCTHAHTHTNATSLSWSSSRGARVVAASETSPSPLPGGGRRGRAGGDESDTRGIKVETAEGTFPQCIEWKCNGEKYYSIDEMFFPSSSYGTTTALQESVLYTPDGCKSSIHSPCCSVFGLHQVTRQISGPLFAKRCTV